MTRQTSVRPLVPHGRGSGTAPLVREALEPLTGGTGDYGSLLTQVGDARLLLLGEQLARERHPRMVFGVGFTTYTGTVTAASDWGAPAERKHVRSALPGSYEALFHEVGVPRFVVTMADHAEAGRPSRRHGSSGRSASSTCRKVSA